jgi:ribokinase
MTKADADAVPVDVDDIVVVQYELPLEVTYAALSRARRNGARTILNPAPAQATPPEMLRLADFVVVNEGELAFFAPGLPIEGGMRALRQRPDQVIIATLGAAGANALVGDDVLHVRGRAVPVVDTTGAGDCFVGALAAALCSWADTEEAVHFANLAASLAVQRLGAGTSMPVLADVEGLA